MSVSPRQTITVATTPSITRTVTVSASLSVTPTSTATSTGTSTAWNAMTQNNLVVLQVGDGLTAIGKGKMAAVYIREFDSMNAPKQTFVVPGVTLPDTGTSYGAITNSLDGSLVVFVAYGAAVGASITSGLKGLAAIVAVNKWGLSKARFFSKPVTASAVYAATTCDNNKFYLSTDVGIYSSSFIGQPLQLETTSTSLSAYRLQCAAATGVGVNQIAGMTGTNVFAGESFFSGGYISEYSTTTALATEIATTKSAAVSTLRGFQMMSFSPSFASFGYQAWFADAANGFGYMFLRSGAGVSLNMANSQTAITTITTAASHGLASGTVFAFIDMGLPAVTGLSAFS